MIHGYNQLPPEPEFTNNDILVIFGEVFARGYINGVIEEAQKKGMKIIYSTVGRRDKEGLLRPLTQDELSEKAQSPFINIPLEAGFDNDPSHEGPTPCEQLQGYKMKEWKDIKINWDQIESSQKKGSQRFKQQIKDYLVELKPHISKGSRVVFVHTMAGGIPRAKIIMPLVNRIFKGYDERFMSSEDFWSTEVGKLCSLSFEDVTANTFEHLINETQSFREEVQSQGGSVTYQAFGYHGTNIFNDKTYFWQSYAPYLQGWAKEKLENIAKKAWDKGVKAQVFNAPEILTNSSSVFLGIEVALYPLLGALIYEGLALDSKVVLEAQSLLKPEHTLKEVFSACEEFFTSPETDYLKFQDNWPVHNTPAQMKLMRETSLKIANMHKNPKALMTTTLSEMVFKCCGRIMLSEADKPQKPVWWVGHDIVAKSTLDRLST